ncbi:hypothetical protein HAQ06_09800 [Pseudomonas sp. C2L12B]|uniref:Transposase n=1 Tax=Pseudomonas typographi TaxID=2715964 RepID=A0ABR7Z5L4_9PSED|nr:hypothetical protein [Pseudomonas typographi]MBD1586950.1 hypothetical protein [Pseudomonas typographi]MBD1600591.1 hypothetical protein [Pseudomonas typographi]
MQECLQPGATVPSVAISHGINANVIRKWLPIYRDMAPQPCQRSCRYTRRPSGRLMRRR